ncbi:MAG: Fic family protein [Clostridiales bacterium]|nr:Fic family protein [Clostridiales bacterium]
MRTFTFDIKPLLTPEIVKMLTTIHECKGKQELYMEAHSDILTTLLRTAKIQSTGASNRIEGIYTSDKRLSELVAEKSEPRNRSEEEIAGYRQVLELVHENYEYMNPSASVVLQLHQYLYSFSASGIAGRWKSTNNAIVEKHEDGTEMIRFKPLSAFETPDAMKNLCDAYIEAISQEQADPLLLSCMFLVDFLCIHPFNDGNGRMSRLLTLLMLYRSGYIVGKYISLEMLIEKNKDSYYDALKASSDNWHEGTNSYEPFTRYMLGIILAAYRDFNSRVAFLSDKKISKPERIRQIFASRLESLTKQELAELCPDISESTIKNTLAQLVKEGYIIKIGAARATKYVKNNQ